MKFENTIEKYNFLETFYYILDDFVQVNDTGNSIYYQISDIFGPLLPKSLVLLDIQKNESAFKERFLYFANMSLFDDADVLLESLTNSYITVLELFEKGAEDRLLGKSIKLSNFPEDVSPGEFLICRVLEIDGEYFVYGDYIPMTFLHAEAVIDEFNRLHTLETLDLKQLKHSSYDLFMLYFASILDENLLSVDVDLFATGAISTLMFNSPELSLYMQMSSFGSEKFFNSTELLGIFYMRILLPQNNNYSSFKRINFYECFTTAVENGYFKNESELFAVLETVIDVYKFFSRFRDDYKLALSSLKEVKQNIFNLIRTLKKSTNGFYYDENLLNLIETPHRVVSDLEKIEEILGIESIVESRTTAALTSKSIQILSDALEVNPIKKVTNYTAYHFPYVDFLYRFLKLKGLVKVYDEVIPTTLLDHFLNFEEEEILALIYTSIFNVDFLNKIYPPIKVKEFSTIFNSLFKKLKVSEINFDELTQEELHFVEGFSRIGLIDIDRVVKLSNTAMAILNYYNSPTNNIVSLNDYR